MFDPPSEFAFQEEWQAALGQADVIGWEPGTTWCALYAIGPWGAAEKLIEDPSGDRAALDGLPLVKAVAYRDASYLWAIDDARCDLWQTTAPPPFTTDGRSLVIGASTYVLADLAEVHSFGDDTDPHWHGVELVMADGNAHSIAAMHTPIDTAWAGDLARTLAARWRVPYRHVVPPACKPAVAAARREAAAQRQQLVEALVDAHDRWDEPDRVAARAAREAVQAKRDAALLTRSYVVTGQRRIAAQDRDDVSRWIVVEADRSTDELLVRVVARGARDAVVGSDDLVGATYRDALLYWVIDGDLCLLFRSRGEVCALCRIGDEVEVGARSLALADLRAVIAFTIPERDGHRGLALELASGECVLVEENDDARYDRGARSAWNSVLAHELAPALGIELREVTGDVIVRPAPPTNPARAIVAACGQPVFARGLTVEERERAARDGRVLYAWSWGFRSMGDTVSHAALGRRDRDVQDTDLVFERPVPPEIDGAWPTWETEADVYADFGLETVTATR